MRLHLYGGGFVRHFIEIHILGAMFTKMVLGAVVVIQVLGGQCSQDFVSDIMNYTNSLVKNGTLRYTYTGRYSNGNMQGAVHIDVV